MFDTSPEEQIRRIVELGAESAESGDADYIAGILSDNYAGPLFDSKAELVSNLRRGLKEMEDLQIDIIAIVVDVAEHGRSAEVECEFYPTGFYTGSSMYNRVPMRGLRNQGPNDPDVLWLDFVKEADEQWRVIGGNIQDVTF